MGIVGDSSVGKTTVSRGVTDFLGRERVTLLSVDDYHRFDRGERAANGHTALDPTANYMDIMEQHLQLLRDGQPILKPVYDHAMGTLERPEYVAPTEFVIAEGLLGYTTKAARDCYDIKVFLEPEEELRVQWKTQRDVAMRGYSRDGVRSQLAKRVQDSAAHIMPQRAFADIVIQFHRKPDDGDTTGPLDVRHSLRPTLPHPDFTSLFVDQTERDLRHSMERDFDSKPVDVLQIDGHISDERTQRIEEQLWGLLPNEKYVQTDLGHYFDGAEPKRSNALALTQLLVAFHMVKAEERSYAV